MMQNKTNSGSEPIPFDAAGYIGTQIKEQSSLGDVISRWLTGDAREVVRTDDETQTMLTDTACLLRVVADAVQKPEDDRTASDYDVSRSLFLAAALVDLGATALDARQEAQFLCEKDAR